MTTNRLTLVLGDQLSPTSPLLTEEDGKPSALWLAEVVEEATHVPSHRARTVQFLTAMRHYRDARRAEGREVHYRELDPDGPRSLASALVEDCRALGVAQVRMLEAGDHRVEQSLRSALAEAAVSLEVHPDPHFLCTRERFGRWLDRQKHPRMEFFYREMRKAFGILMDPAGKPEGGKWNFDHDNRKSFGKEGPPELVQGGRFEPDALTRAVMNDVERVFPDSPGSLEHFAWPVTPAQAEAALDDFIAHRLPDFGRYQDAMWTGRPFLFHARLSSALNLKLLDPRVVVERAEEAWRAGDAPLNAVEGFIRQIIGWREYVRGIYFARMPGYLEENALGHVEPLPEFFWTGETPMRCLSETIGQTLEHAYAHHIQRLMVTGLYTLLLGVDPKAVHEWYLAVYVDAVEWVEAPNVLGMSQYADGGFLASKPYAATGKYIQRMSNYCGHCPLNPTKRLGDDACPFTTLYWDFLLRHEARFADHPRMALQVRNLGRIDDEERAEIRARGDAIRANGGQPPSV